MAAGFLGVQGWACTIPMALRPGRAASCLGPSKTGPVAWNTAGVSCATDKGSWQPKRQAGGDCCHLTQAPSNRHGVNAV